MLEHVLTALAGFVDDVLTELDQCGFGERANLRQTVLAVRGPTGQRLSNGVLNKIQTVNSAFKVARHLAQLPMILGELRAENGGLSGGSVRHKEDVRLPSGWEPNKSACIDLQQQVAVLEARIATLTVAISGATDVKKAMAGELNESMQEDAAVASGPRPVTQGEIVQSAGPADEERGHPLCSLWAPKMPIRLATPEPSQLQMYRG